MLAEELLSACKLNNSADVQQLLQSPLMRQHMNDLVQRKYEDGEYRKTTALNCAYEHSSHAIVQQLIKHGAKDISTSDGERGIHRACLSKIDTLAKVKQLVTADPDNVHLKDGNCKRTPLYIASKKDHNDVVEYLLNAGCDLHASGSDGAEAIHIAAAVDAAQVIHTLIRWGAQINMQDSNGDTPLLRAAKCASVNAAEALTSYANCDISLKNKRNQSALEKAKSMPFKRKITSSQYNTFIAFMEQLESSPSERVTSNVNCIEHLFEKLQIDTNNMNNIQKQECKRLEAEIKDLKKRMNDLDNKSLIDSRMIRELQKKVEKLNEEVIELSKEVTNLRSQSTGASNEATENVEASLLADAIRYNYKNLVRDVASYDLIDDLFSKRALSLDEKQLVEAEKTDTLKMKKLLDILLGKKSLEWAPKFVKILKQNPKCIKSLKQIQEAHREPSFLREDIE